MFGLGIGELSVIFAILVVLFGASKLPEFGQGLGKGIGNFKKAISEEHTKIGGSQGD
ncbi:MAG: twin-arginine translocase TatA/TatE family subunit [Nitrospirota bacterium]|jgi:sec-independent protein translocase protein TatA